MPKWRRRLKARQRRTHGFVLRTSLPAASWRHFASTDGAEINLLPGGMNYVREMMATEVRARQSERLAEMEACLVADRARIRLNREIRDMFFYGNRLDREAQVNAQQRALDLLRKWLSPAQLKEFDESRCFHVIGCDSGQRYLVTLGVVQNVFTVNERDEKLIGHCFGPSGHLAAGDVMLAQKIALETMETEALRVANTFMVTRPEDYLTLQDWSYRLHFRGMPVMPVRVVERIEPGVTGPWGTPAIPALDAPAPSSSAD